MDENLVDVMGSRKGVRWAGERDVRKVAWKGKLLGVWMVGYLVVHSADLKGVLMVGKKGTRMVLCWVVRWVCERDVRKVAWKDFYWVVRWVGLKGVMLGAWKVLWKDANLVDVMGSRKAVQ